MTYKQNIIKLAMLGVFALLSLNANSIIENDDGEFTQIFSIRSLENGITLSAKRDSTEQQNWALREISLPSGVRDRIGEKLPFGYVQFVDPNNQNSCLAIDESGFFTTKNCEDDIKSKDLESVFSIIPTLTTAVQIRSLVLNGDECISTFENPNVPIEKRFGINPCAFDVDLQIPFSLLFVITPPLIKSRVL